MVGILLRIMIAIAIYQYKVKLHYRKCKNIVKQLNIIILSFTFFSVLPLYQFTFIVQIQGEDSNRRELFFHAEDLNGVS